MHSPGNTGEELERYSHRISNGQSGITYLLMAKGFCYLVTIMDWTSRKVLAWRLSNTLDASFWSEALEEAIRRFGAPEIFNTDQGSQFTSEAFMRILDTFGINISMDGVH